MNVSIISFTFSRWQDYTGRLHELYQMHPAESVWLRVRQCGSLTTEIIIYEAQWIRVKSSCGRLSGAPAMITRAVLSPGNRAKPRKFRYAEPVGNFILQCRLTSFTFVYESWEDNGDRKRKLIFSRQHSYLTPSHLTSEPRRIST